MPDFYKKGNKDPYRQFFIRLGMVVVVLVLAALVVANVKVHQKKQELNAQVKSLQQRVQDLKNQNTNLKEGMARASDDAYIEKVAREELDLQLPGETVFSVVQTGGQQQSPAAQKNTWSTWVGNAWNSFINIFKK